MEEKVCKYCQKPVDVKAVKCPYCQEWLKKLHWGNPMVYSWVLMGIFVIFPLVVKKTFMDKYENSDLFKEPLKYSENHKLKLNQTNLIKEKNGIRLISEIENQEKFPWDSVEILSIYYDKNNKPFYLGTKYLSNLKPGEKRPFQIDPPCSEENVTFSNFDHYELKIETASAKPWKK
jgi:hypothetical protein